MTSRWLRTDRWTSAHVVAAVALAALGVAVTWSAWADIYHIAEADEESSHIFLVPIVALWMLWARRLRFRYCKPTGTLLGPAIVALGWITSLIGFYRGTGTLWHGGAVLVVIGCVVSVLGKQAILRFLPVMAVLIFLVPVPGEVRLRIALPLQTWTAHIEQTTFEILGTDVQRAGNCLTINGKNVNIIEACNGLRMVFALILVSYAFSFGLPLRNRVRLLILLSSPFAAIGCNLIRILPTVWLYGNARPAVARAFHDFSGWLMLPIALLMLLGIMRLLRWAMIPVMRYTLAT